MNYNSLIHMKWSLSVACIHLIHMPSILSLTLLNSYKNMPNWRIGELRICDWKCCWNRVVSYRRCLKGQIARRIFSQDSRYNMFVVMVFPQHLYGSIWFLLPSYVLFNYIYKWMECLMFLDYNRLYLIIINIPTCLKSSGMAYLFPHVYVASVRR